MVPSERVAKQKEYVSLESHTVTMVWEVITLFNE